MLIIIVVLILILLIIKITSFVSYSYTAYKKEALGFEERPRRSTLANKHQYAIMKVPNPTLNIHSQTIIPDEIIESYQTVGLSYRVSISEMCCTCPDFKKHRKLYNMDDPLRICKHIYEVLSKNNFLSMQTELALVIMENSAKNKNLLTIKLSNGNEASICYGGNEWVDVFTRKKQKEDRDGNYSGKYGRYGYNINEKSWSYGDSPSGAREIKSILSKII